jgi:hypothetical protein
MLSILSPCDLFVLGPSGGRISLYIAYQYICGTCVLLTSSVRITVKQMAGVTDL